MPGNGLAALDTPLVGEEPSEQFAADVRPILPRNSENAWQRCEAIRAELSELIEQACRRRNLQALVLQSHPFAQPIWVKFESWAPLEGSTLTARASMTVTLAPMPYRRFETIYSIAWEKHGQSGAFGQLYRFGAAEIEHMLDLLCSKPEGQLTGFRVRRILKPGQLRMAPLQLWRPRNKVVAVRRDWLKIAAWLFALAGVGLLIAGDPSIDDFVLPPAADIPPSYSPGMATGPTAPPAPPTAAPAPPTQPANKVNGELGPADSRLPDGRYYDEYTYRKQPGEEVRITMRSSALDPFLIAGLQAAGEFNVLASNDDLSPNDLNAVLILSAQLGGEIVIRATSAKAGEHGAYTLEVSGK